MRQLPSGTVTFLFTDIEGSTRLLAELGEGYAEALAEHRRVLREAFRRHRGVEVDTQGDAFFYAFRSAGEAVAAADEAQAALTDGRIRVRIGIHAGEPQRTDEGYVGLDVHRAARICSTAHGGQVVLSERTCSLLDSPFSLVDLGLHRLKDLGEAEKLFQLGDRTFPPLQSLNATNLPAQPSPLVGREGELDEVQALVRAHRLVTLTGAGGSGKTRLGLQVAAELTDEFKDGVFWVPLAALTDSELVLTTIAATLGARDRLAEHIDEKRMLLLLDNLEQIVECAPALAELLESCPNLRLLATSRALLRLSSERGYEVPPLPEHDAVALFRARALQTEPLAAVRDICRRLDGLPLAIELAAARTGIFPPDKLLERLEQRLPLLTGGRRDAPERQRTLRAAIEWSYDLLSPQDRQLFAQLAVFAGGFDLEAADSVCEADLDTLESLVEQSLLRRTEEGRFFYLETIRELALEKLAASGEESTIRRRHAEHFLALAQSANLHNEAEGEQRHDIVIRDRDNVRGALEWARDSGEIELGLRLAVALENYWATNNPREGVSWVGELLEQAGELPGDLRARALRTYGASTYIFGDFETGTRYYEASLAEYHRLGDERGIAILIHRLAGDALRRGERERARTLGEKSLGLHRKVKFKRGEAQALSLIAHLELDEGNEELGIELLGRSAALCQEIGFTWWRAGVLLDLSELLLERGRLAESEARAREALPLVERMGDRQNTIWALALLARLAAETGRVTHAGRLWGVIEAEEARAPVGQWEEERETYAEPVLARAGPEFEQGRQDGWRLSLWEAVEDALEARESQVSPPAG
jgi:predicted ATPase/class 3 adenylate cyclase